MVLRFICDLTRRMLGIDIARGAVGPEGYINPKHPTWKVIYRIAGNICWTLILHFAVQRKTAQLKYRILLINRIFYR